MDLVRLEETFASVMALLRQSRHMQRYLSPKTLEVIKRLGALESPRLGGERCRVTVLFSDVRGFTSMTESLEPEEVVQMLNIYLNLQAEVVYQRGGFVDKFVGDEVMAIFTDEDSEYRAALAAQEIRNFVRSLNEARSKAGKRCMNVGIGLNTGDVVMGNMGSELQMDYTVIGDPINTAARLCHAAAPGQVVMSRPVSAKLGARVQLRVLGPIRAKGKSRPVEAAELLDVPGLARGHMRRRLDLEAPCSLPGVRAVRLRDISQGGCSLEAPVPVERGAELELSVPLGDVALGQVRGVVRHGRKVEGGWRAGVSFEGLGEEERSRLTEWVHRLSPGAFKP